VQQLGLNLFPFRYSKIKRIDVPPFIDTDSSILYSYAQTEVEMYKAPLPLDVIEPFVVVLEWRDLTSGVTYRSEARKMIKKEMFSTQMHSFNMPSKDNPVYAMERQLDATPQYWMYISGLSWLDSTGTKVDLFTTSSYVVVELWYTSALDDLELFDGNNDIDVSTPPDMEELVIYYAMLYAMQETNAIQEMPSVNAEIQMMWNLLKQNYMIAEADSNRWLPSKIPLQ
jgi:hypothetical protein